MTWQSIALSHKLEPAQIAQFISRFDGAFSGKLSGHYDYPRVVSLAHFAAALDRLGIAAQSHTGVVAGDLNEPELHFMDSGEVSVLRWDRDSRFDLDKPWFSFPSQNFSMTLCNQALEHVFDPQLAFENLVHQTKPGGHIYITIPTINCIHGEPHFYSSGYHPRFLERLGAERGLEIVSLGYWGSYKFMLNSVSGVWLSHNQLAAGPNGGNLFPGLESVDGRPNDDRFISACWALFKTPG